MQTDPFYMEKENEILKKIEQEPKWAEQAIDALLNMRESSAESAIREAIGHRAEQLRILHKSLHTFAEQLPLRRALFEEADGSRFYSKAGIAIEESGILLAAMQDSSDETIAWAVREMRTKILQDRFLCELLCKHFPALVQKATVGLETTKEREDRLERLFEQFGQTEAGIHLFLSNRAVPFLKRLGELTDVAHRGEQMHSSAVRELCIDFCSTIEALRGSIVKALASI